ncbi:hypothetical protein F3Y22_tig00111027pilonHSYRG00727 [Hibiscus syriacus]|uniref:Uncharacterized protein n=1 Tax=Hibiscus syriacus TaxID=106335 RepID=A0A6A2Z5N0_HIBSY|nr:hypothetical protein F3Y22_tig00111027pilonHSYRG00727 [Hibiscus syriacus]
MDDLLCDEVWLSSPETEYCRLKDNGYADSFYTTKEDSEQAIVICLEKELSYMPEPGYLDYLLSSNLVFARFRAVQWLIKALKWRLCSTTTYSYIELITSNIICDLSYYLQKELINQVNKTLLKPILDSKLLPYPPSFVAVSALWCNPEASISREHYPSSPVTVLLMERIVDIIDCRVDLSVFGMPLPGSNVDNDDVSDSGVGYSQGRVSTLELSFRSHLDPTITVAGGWKHKIGKLGFSGNPNLLHILRRECETCPEDFGVIADSFVMKLGQSVGVRYPSLWRWNHIWPIRREVEPGNWISFVVKLKFNVSCFVLRPISFAVKLKLTLKLESLLADTSSLIWISFVVKLKSNLEMDASCAHDSLRREVETAGGPFVVKLSLEIGYPSS